MNPNEVLRIYADWLSGDLLDYAGAPQGFEVHRANVPKDVGDAVPRAVTVFDESRNLELAGGDVPEAVAVGPLLLVTLSQGFQLDGEIGTDFREADNVNVAIAFASQDIETAEGITEAGLAVRTVARSLTELHHNNNVDLRRRNGIVILSCNSMNLLTVRNDPTDANKNILGAVVLDLLVRDENPSF